LLIESGKDTEVLINTTELKINAADLGFIPSKRLILVPAFNDNKLNAYRLKL
jgi:hypothetical protein